MHEEGLTAIHIYDRYVTKMRMSFFAYRLSYAHLYVHTSMYVYKVKLTAGSREVKMDKTKEDEEKPFHLREEREGEERASVFPDALLGNCFLLRFAGPGTWARPLAQRTTQIHRRSNRYLERRTKATPKVLRMDSRANFVGICVGHRFFTLRLHAS